MFVFHWSFFRLENIKFKSQSSSFELEIITFKVKVEVLVV